MRRRLHEAIIWLLAAASLLVGCAPSPGLRGGLIGCGYCPVGPPPRGPIGPVPILVPASQDAAAITRPPPE